MKKTYLSTVVSSILFANSALAANTNIISIDNNGLAGTDTSSAPKSNENGSKIVFESKANNLIPNNNGKQQIILRNTSTNNTILVSTPNGSQSGDDTSNFPYIDNSGTFITFSSLAKNLVTENTKNVSQIYLRDINGTTTRLISKAGSTGGNRASELPSISNDGNYIVFESDATDLVSDDNNGVRDIFLYSRINGTIERISVAGTNTQVSKESNKASVSNDGRFIAFSSLSGTLDSNDTNSNYDIFLRDRLNRTTTLISRAPNGQSATGLSTNPKISSDGRYVVYQSNAANLIGSNGSSLNQIYIYDTVEKTTILASRAPTGDFANSININPDISDNGRFVTFTSLASNLVNGDGNGAADVFIYDQFLNSTEIANLSNNGTQSTTNVSFFSSISGDGKRVLFGSRDSIFSSSSTINIFARTRDQFTNILPVAHAGNDQSIQCTAGGTNVSLDGSKSYDRDGLITNYKWSNGATIATGQKPSAILNPGRNFVELTVTDDRQATASATIIVDIFDNIAPTITVTQPPLLEATSTNGASYPIKYVTADNCSPVSVIMQPSLSTYPMGTSTVNVSATDTAGNKKTTSVSVTVQDTTPPTLNLPINKVAEANGILSTVSIGSATASDIFPVTVSSDNPGTFPLGNTDIHWKAVDSNGNTTRKTQLVTVQDTTPPLLKLPDDLTNEASGPLTYVDIGMADATDIFDVTVTNDSPGLFKLGSNIVNWEARDINGNVATAQQRVVIKDSIAPTMTLDPSSIVEATHRTETPFSIPYSTNDSCNCGDLEVTRAPSLEVYPLGKTEVDLTVTDQSGNASIQHHTVHVVDTTAPLLTLAANMDVEATAILTPVSLTSPTATDIFDTTLTNNAPVSFPYGLTSVEWTATDSNNNSSKAIQSVNIKDTTAPVVVPPANISSEATGPLTTVMTGTAVVTEIFNYTLKHDAPAAFALGDTLVNWKAVDEHGNSATKQQKITIVDTTAPSVNAGNDQLLEATKVEGADFNITPIVSDICNCGNLDITYTPALSTYPLGSTTVTVKAVDQSGNVATDTITINVVDTTVPVLFAPQDILIEAQGEFTVVDLGQPSVSDIFGVQTLNNAPASFPVGTTVVTWMATDINGNQVTQMQNVTVQDTTAPEFNFTLLKDTLWAPNHKMVHVATLDSVKDIVDPQPNVNITVESNGHDHRHHRLDREDSQIKQQDGRWEVWLRSEKLFRNHDERTYTINVEITDKHSNVASTSAEVIVPRNRKHDDSRDNNHTKRDQSKEKHSERNERHNDKKSGRN